MTGLIKRLAGMSLRKRILVALAAIALIHACFYAGPRWWYSWPRFYPQGYEQALSLLKETFGEAAVANGVVRIPKDAVVVPYKGFAKVEDTLSRTTLHVYLAGDEAYFYFDGLHGKECVELAARTPSDKGREAWALFAYIERLAVKGNLRTYCAIESARTYTGFCNRVWVDKGGENTSYFAAERWHEQRDGLSYAQGLLRARAVRRILDSDPAAFTSEAENRRRVLKAFLAASIPPRSSWDRDRICLLAQSFAPLAGEGDLGTLRKIKKAQVRREWYWFVYRLPFIGKWLAAKQRTTVGVGPMSADEYRNSEIYPNYVNLDGYIWAIEALRGKSRAERLRILSEAAFGNTKPDKRTVAYEARKRLEREFPREYRDLLVENFQSLCGKFDAAADSTWWARAIAADDRFARLAATTAYARTEPLVCAQLYETTGDKSYLDSMKDIVMTAQHPPGKPEISRAAMRALYDACEKDRSLADIPAITRQVFEIISREPEDILRYADDPLRLGYDLLSSMMPVDDVRSAAIMSDLLNEPEKVLAPEDARSHRLERLRAEAATALGWSRLPEAHDALMRKAKSPGFLDDKPVAAAVLTGLAISGDARALPLLRQLAGEAFQNAMPAGASKPVILCVLGDVNETAGAAAVELACAPDRCEHFATLDLSTIVAVPNAAVELVYPLRRLIPMTVLSRVFSADELQRLLADPRCADARGRLLMALYIRDALPIDRDMVKDYPNRFYGN